MTCVKGFFLMAVIAAVLVTSAGATSYFVDSQNGSDPRSGTSDATSWQSLAKVNGTTFQAGDTIKFKCGGSWTGQLGLDNSGASGNPVVYTSYGTGAKPVIGNAGGTVVTVSAQYVTCDGFLLDGLNMNVTGNDGVYVSPACSYGVFRNLEITRVGEGLWLEGSNHLITHCYIHDLHMSVNNPGGDNDCGARAIDFSNASDIEASYNRIERCTQPSYDYGTDGGAFEIWLAVARVKIHHNYVYRANGILEGGGTGQAVSNISLYYNVFVDNVGVWLAIHTNDNFSIVPSNFTMDNNTFIRSGSAWNGGNWLTMRNNIFYNSSGGGNQSNNFSGYPLFADTAAGNFHLRPGSPCIDSGITLGYTVDFDDVPVPQGTRPDIGAYEFVSTSAQPPAPAMTPPALRILSRSQVAVPPGRYSLRVVNAAGITLHQESGTGPKISDPASIGRSPGGVRFVMVTSGGTTVTKAFVKMSSIAHNP